MNESTVRHSSTSVHENVSHGNTLIAKILLEELRDSGEAYELRDEVLLQARAAHAANVIFDAQNVRFIGSVGFLAFLGVRRHLPGGRIILCNLTEPIRKTFEICRLIPNNETATAPFEVAADVDAALAKLQG